MMKFAFALLSLLSAVKANSLVSGPEIHVGQIDAGSDLGRGLLTKARRLDQDAGDDSFNENWVSGYSLKFQGCHQISQWNDAIESEEDVRIATKRLVRFRLCPSDSCSTSSSSGCSEGYGDYVVDMNTYLEYYFSARQTYQQFECSYLTNYVCGCEGDSDCLSNCYAEHNMQGMCKGNGNNNNNNNAADDGAVIDLGDYMTCAKSNYKDEDGNSLYVGPYCAAQGGSIYLGAFRDDACTITADNTMGTEAFLTATGYALPYSSANVVDLDCLSCKEPSEKNNDGNDAEDSDEVAEVCEAVYSLAGKCESNLGDSVVQYPNTNGCNYLEGIKIVRKDGTVITANIKANRTAVAFITIFTLAFVFLSFYVYYLKMKLDRSSINLAE
jgi:hypothetical protein